MLQIGTIVVIFLATTMAYLAESTVEVDASTSKMAWDTACRMRNQIELKLWPVNSWRPSSSRAKIQPVSFLTMVAQAHGQLVRTGEIHEGNRTESAPDEV